MIAAERHAQALRNCEDDQKSVGGCLLLAFQSHFSLQDVQHVHKSIIVDTNSAKAMGDAVCISLGLLHTADILFESDTSNKSITAAIYSSTKSDVQVVFNLTKEPECLTMEKVRLIMETSPISCVISLGSVPLAFSFSGSSTAPPLKKISTSACEYIDIYQKYIADFPMLEVGNIVTGLCASIITYAEPRNIPAILLVCTRGAALSIQSMEAFEGSLPLLEYLANMTLKRPDKQAYSKISKSDTFLSSTQSIYC